MTSVNYKSAGVDIAAGNEAVRRIKQDVESTFSKAVLSPLGGFGALYDLQELMTEYTHPVLVQSIDGVGTKMMVARMLQKFDTIGRDLVSATANDIVVLGAKPLTLLDYIANDHLDPNIVESIVHGMVLACLENGIALIGGETAEMPGTYLPYEHDLVGVITGVVEKDKIITGKAIIPSDRIYAFASSGLHTNGYSLARKLILEVGKYTLETYLPALGQTLGEALLAPHLNYTQPVLHCLAAEIPIHGMAHITGGGLLENLPRILPANCNAVINQASWTIPPLFTLLCELGKLTLTESYRTFNMGVGLVMIAPPQAEPLLQEVLLKFPDFNLFEIGEITEGTRLVEFS
jgi:phosphoribosylformylglycinamidine cyclo-ligase